MPTSWTDRRAAMGPTIHRRRRPRLPPRVSEAGARTSSASPVARNACDNAADARDVADGSADDRHRARGRRIRRRRGRGRCRRQGPHGALPAVRARSKNQSRQAPGLVEARSRRSPRAPPPRAFPRAANDIGEEDDGDKPAPGASDDADEDRSPGRSPGGGAPRRRVYAGWCNLGDGALCAFVDSDEGNARFLCAPGSALRAAWFPVRRPSRRFVGSLQRRRGRPGPHRGSPGGAHKDGTRRGDDDDGRRRYADAVATGV